VAVVEYTFTHKQYSRPVLTHYCAGDEIEKNEMGGACSGNGGGEGRVQGFGGTT
jgi:hypothetical protein